MICTEGFWKGLLGRGGETDASVGSGDACSDAQEVSGHGAFRNAPLPACKSMHRYASWSPPPTAAATEGHARQCRHAMQTSLQGHVDAASQQPGGALLAGRALTVRWSLLLLTAALSRRRSWLPWRALRAALGTRGTSAISMTCSSAGGLIGGRPARVSEDATPQSNSKQQAFPRPVT